MELADTTVWSWTRRADARELRTAFDDLVIAGEIATCDMVRLELLHSARNAAEFADLRRELSALRDCPIGKAQWSRAISVYEELAGIGGGHQRSVKHADLLIAAAAEAAGVTVLHYDEDFERIAAVTGQPMRWIARKGSLR